MREKRESIVGPLEIAVILGAGALLVQNLYLHHKIVERSAATRAEIQRQIEENTPQDLPTPIKDIAPIPKKLNGISFGEDAVQPA